MSRFQMLSDAQWSLIEGMLPRPTGCKGKPFADARLMVEGIIYRYRTGIAWRDLPAVFGPWQTVWTWHHRMVTESTWDRVLAKVTSTGLTRRTTGSDSTRTAIRSRRSTFPSRATASTVTATRGVDSSRQYPRGGPFSYGSRSLPYQENPSAYHQYEWVHSPADVQSVYDGLDDQARATVDDQLAAYGRDLGDLGLVTRGEAAAIPAWDTPGGATQDLLPVSVKLLDIMGMIREV